MTGEAHTLQWQRGRDPDHHDERYLFRASLPDGYLVVVSEISAGDWGWTVSEPVTGFPCHIRYGYANPDDAKAGAELYVKENP